MNKILVIGLSGQSEFLSVDHFNKPGETLTAQVRFTEPGGKGYNQALALGKIGANVSFITCLGNDSYADTCIDVLKEFNVNVYPIYKDTPCDFAVIMTNVEGENNVCVYHGASSLCRFNDVMKYKDVIDNSDIILLQLEYPMEVTEEVIKYAYKNNKKVILNPAPYNPKFNKDLLKMIYAITPNEFELCNLAGCDNTMDAIKKLDIDNIICTQGSKSVVVKSEGKIKKIDVRKVKAIDTTGAGDIFNAYFVYNLDKGIYESSRIASIASTLSVLKKGVVNAIPGLIDVKRFMENTND